MVCGRCKGTGQYPEWMTGVYGPEPKISAGVVPPVSYFAKINTCSRCNGSGDEGLPRATGEGLSRATSEGLS